MSTPSMTAATAPVKYKVLICMDIPITQDKHVHSTIVYCGLRDQKELDEIVDEVGIIYSKGAFTPSNGSNTHIKFGEFKVLGKPDEVKAGGGVLARLYELVEGKGMSYSEMITDLHKKFYYAEEGEDPARKERVLLHVTLGKECTNKEKLTNEVLGSLDVVDTGEVCPLVVLCKAVGSTEWKEATSSFKWGEAVRSIKRAEAAGSLKPEALASIKRSLMGL